MAPGGSQSHTNTFQIIPWVLTKRTTGYRAGMKYTRASASSWSRIVNKREIHAVFRALPAVAHLCCFITPFISFHPVADGKKNTQ